MTLDEALKLLKEIILGQIYHRDYERVVGLSRLYKILITGENHTELLQRFITREDTVLFDQRERITQTITPAVCDSLMKPFYKVGRAGGVIKNIDFDKVNDKKVKELKDTLYKFHGDESLEDYLNTRLTDLNFTDPNSFLMVDFKSFDPKIEKAQPYPLEISSEQAMNFNYANNKLEWLVVNNEIYYSDKEGNPQEGSEYFMYLANDIIKLTQVNIERNVAGEEYVLIGEKDDEQKFIITYYQPKGGQVQGVRVGYKRDLITNGRTFVNPFHAAVNYFLKMVKIVSELDLTTSLSAFPQKITYVDRIDEKDESKDVTTALANSSAFKKYDSRDAYKTLRSSIGSKKMSTSSQETIEVPFPEDPQDIIDLNKLVVYVAPPVEFLKWMSEETGRLEEKAHRTVFNSNSFLQANFSATATATLDDIDSVYDTLFPFASKYSTVWVLFVTLSAKFTDNAEGLIAVHKFPSDFKFKTIGQLLAEMKAANDAGASSYVKEEINKDLAKAAFADDPETLKKNLTKERFAPFKGKSEAQILFILNNNKTTSYFSTLWANFDVIFDQIEIDTPDFYDMDPIAQSKVVKAAVDVIEKQLPVPAAAFSLRTAQPA